MKIGMIETVSSHGGMNYYDFGLINSLSKLVDQVFFYTSEELKFDFKGDVEVFLSYKNLFKAKKRLEQMFIFLFGTIRSVLSMKRKKVELLHYQIFSISILEFFVVRFAKLMGLKVVVTIHDIESFNKENKKWIKRIFYKNLDGIIVHNKVSYLALENQKEIEYFKGEILIAHHGSYIGLLPEKIDKKIAKKSFNIPIEDFVFLFFGQIKKVKGLDILLKAFASISNNKNRNIWLLVAGKVWKDDFSIYKKIIDDYAIDNNIIMNIGYVDDDEVVNYYSAADCVILPYRKIYQSGVLLMAQSFKVPVLVSNLPGMVEIVTNNENGFIFDSGSEESLKYKMEEIIAYKDLSIVVDKAYENLEVNYSWDRIARLQCDFLKKILEK